MEKAKKVFHQLVVDTQTGEIIRSVEHYVTKHSESFGMYRRTDGLGWVLDLSGNELKTLILLHDLSEMDGSVSLSPARRVNLCRLMKIGKRNLSSVLTGLVRKDALFRVNNNDFVINPSTFFKCSSNDLKKRIEAYYELKGFVQNTSFEIV